eukprot:3013510-Rhodomonas_salina.1
MPSTPSPSATSSPTAPPLHTSTCIMAWHPRPGAPAVRGPRRPTTRPPPPRAPICYMPHMQPFRLCNAPGPKAKLGDPQAQASIPSKSRSR